jgi:hypothetical protein
VVNVTYIAINIALGLLSVAAFFLVGRAFTYVARIKTSDVWAKLVLYPTFGFVIFALTLFFIGLLGLYNKPVAFGLLALGYVAAAVKPRELKNELISIFTSVYRTLTTPKEFTRFILGWLVIAITAICAVRSGAPELDFSVLGYHFALPAKYIAAGKLYWVPDNRASSFPLYEGQIHLYGMLLYSTALARLLATYSWTLLIGATFLLARRAFNPSAGKFAAIILALTPFFLGYASTGLNTVWWSLFFVLSIYYLERWSESEKINYIAVSGALAGFAFGSKILHGFLLPIYVGIIIYYIILRRFGLKSAVFGVLVFAVLFFAVCSPWFIRNYAYTGEVLGFVQNDYDFVAMSRSETVPGGLFSRLAWFVRLGGFKGPDLPTWSLLYYIPGLFLKGDMIWGGSFGLGLVYLPGTLLGLALPGKRRKAIFLGATIILFCLIWIFFMKMNTPRYFAPAIPLLAVLSGRGFARAANFRNNYLRFSAAALLIFALAYSNLTTPRLRSLYKDEIGLSLGRYEPQSYILQGLYGGRDLPSVIAGLPPGSTVLSIDDRILYLIDNPTPVYVAYRFNNFFFDFSSAENPYELRKAMAERGFTHVIDWRLTRHGNVDHFFPGAWCGGDSRYAQYSFKQDFLYMYGVPVPGPYPYNRFGDDYLFELSPEPIRPLRQAYERSGPGYDYPINDAPDVFKPGE